MLLSMRKAAIATSLVLLIISPAGVLHAQPYYYFSKYENVTPVTADIYRVDLSNGTTTTLMANIGNVLQLFQGPDQSRLFLQYPGGILETVELNDSNRIMPILQGFDWIFNVLDAPLIDRIYVLEGTDEDMERIVVLKRSDYEVLDTIPLWSWLNDTKAFFLSQDESFLYGVYPDTLNGGDIFVTIQTSTNSIIDRVPLSTIPPKGTYKMLIEGHEGAVLLGYDRKYDVYYPGNGSSSSSVDFPWPGDGLLSPDNSHVIVNKVNYIVDDSVSRTGHNEYPGIVYVFNANTAQLTQRLSLPPNGKILVIDGYPHMFYYYNDSTNQAVPISDTVVTPTNALIDTLISLKHQAVAKGWLKNDRNRGHDIDDMMRGNEWYKEGEAGKFRSWEVGKDWQFDHDWNNGIVGVLDKRLEMAKRALDRGDSVMARRNLEIFVMEVELLNKLSTKLVKRGEEPILTNDGYLSLKFNAEYVIDRLPEREGKHEGGRRREKGE